MNKNIFLPIFCVLLLLTSCTTKDKVNSFNYLQDAENIATEASLSHTTSYIQTGDQFVILITAKDMNVVKPFNQNYFSGELLQTSVPNGNSPNQGQEKISGPTYIVDAEGMIDFPVLGKLNTTGKTIVQFKDELRDRLSEFIKNPSVSLRLVNYKITVLGEVNKPGIYTVPDGQSNVLNALGLAGDLTMYGRRDDILLVRNENGVIIKERINLLNASFMNSPYYQLKQGDVLYVSANPTKEKTAKLDPNTSTYIAIAGTIIGLAGIFITIFKN